MSAQTIITTGWTVSELRRLADQMKHAVHDQDQRKVVTMTILGDTVSTSTKHTITLACGGVTTVLPG